jgi:capsular exopolysaccharide synthesis family protein
MGHHHESDADPAAPTAGGFRPHFLTVLWQRKLLVGLGAVVGLVLAALYYAQATPVYKSTAQVLVVKKRSSDAVPVAGGDPRLAVMEDYLASHLVVLRSPVIAERAVKKRELQKLPSLAGSGDPAGVIAHSLTATREKDGTSSGPSNIINLSYSGPVAEDCALILAAVIESYKDFLDEKFRNFSDDTLELITKGRDVLERGLRDKEKAYREFRETSPLIWKGKEGLTVQQERVAGIEARRSALLMRQANLRDRIKDVEKAAADGRPRAEVLALVSARPDGKEAPAPAPDLFDTQMVPLLLQEQQLLQDHGPDHPDVVSVRRRIAFLRELLQQHSAAYQSREAVSDPVERCLEKLRQDLRDAEAEYQSLTTLVDAESKEARRFDSYAMQDENYRNDIARNQKMFDAIVSRLQEINLVRDAGGFDAAPLARPAPGAKVAPGALQVALAGVALGLLLGVGLAYLGEVTDKGFRTADEIRRRLGLPVIGHIPLLTPDAAAKEKVQAGEPTLDPYLCACHRPKSVEAEAYRAVRTALYFSTHGAGHSVFQVTSPDMGDGKSTLVTNLAVCVAQSGKKTIVIDADLRRPRLHRMFGQAAPCGLADVIAGRVAWRDAVRPGPVPNLFVLPCGPLPPNPAELLTSPKFQAVLDEVRAEYDIVLVDTPPLLAVTDPCAVAPRVDGVILTLRLSKKSGPQAERAREILASLGVKVVGVVVNGVTTRSGAARYGGGQYEYTYGSNEYTAEADEAGEGYYAEGGEGDATPPSAAAAQPPRKPAGAARHGLLRWFKTLCGL